MTRRTAVTAVVGVAIASAFSVLRAQQPPSADLLLTNGKSKDIRPVMTIVGGRIVYDAATGGEPTAPR